MLYGALKLITAPTVEPVVVADVKEWLRVESGVTADDNLCASLLKAVRRNVEHHTKRNLCSATWDWVLDDALPSEPFNLPLPPVQSVTGIYFTDDDDVEGSAVSTSKYLVDVNDKMRPARVILKSGSTWGDTDRRSVMGTRIRIVAGYGSAGTTTAASGATAGDVPEDIVLAIKRMILTNYENREDVLVDASVASIPKDARMLLAPYRVLRV